jgi:hypothetical protein
LLFVEDGSSRSRRERSGASHRARDHVGRQARRRGGRGDVGEAALIARNERGNVEFFVLAPLDRRHPAGVVLGPGGNGE